MRLIQTSIAVEDRLTSWPPGPKMGKGELAPLVVIIARMRASRIAETEAERNKGYTTE